MKLIITKETIEEIEYEDLAEREQAIYTAGWDEGYNDGLKTVGWIILVMCGAALFSYILFKYFNNIVFMFGFKILCFYTGFFYLSASRNFS